MNLWDLIFISEKIFFWIWIFLPCLFYNKRNFSFEIFVKSFFFTFSSWFLTIIFERFFFFGFRLRKKITVPNRPTIPRVKILRIKIFPKKIFSLKILKFSFFWEKFSFTRFLWKMDWLFFFCLKKNFNLFQSIERKIFLNKSFSHSSFVNEKEQCKKNYPQKIFGGG